MAKKPNELEWIEELLPVEVFRKPMFGGFAYYFSEKLVLVTFESEGDRSYKNQSFDFDIWNGCMFPAERDFHSQIQKQFPFLINHPVLPKWFYLPQQTEDFDEKVTKVIKKIFLPGSIWGTIPKVKKKNRGKPINPQVKIDTRRPQMFRDPTQEPQFEKLKKISELKNLGPATEIHFTKIGIKTPKQFQKLGWKKTLIKLVKLDGRNAHTVFAYALIGALENKEWFRLSPEEKLEASQFTKDLRAKIKKQTPAKKGKKKQLSKR